MPPLILRQRRPELIEKMDREDCDPDKLHTTYRQFRSINRLLSQWDKVYNRYIRPMCSPGQTLRILDIGFGGGDIPFYLQQRAKEDGLEMHITAIETDRRALEYVEKLPNHPEIEFRLAHTSELVEEHIQFDLVISNHLLHHLDENSFSDVLRDAEILANRRIIFNDIERSDIGFSLFAPLSFLLFSGSFVCYDGCISIRKSFTKKELQQHAPEGWSVQRLFPFRLLLLKEVNHG